ncbi:MAG: gliding motility-associated C-terminal domain-containing protein [Flavobacteriales bacterium]|nr:gliding motility-associated C-terminal domain-containing protein [Flavobacteriales bacterium]
MTKNEHNIEDIFREAFASHEMDVSPKVWSGIEASLGQAGAAASGAAGGTTFLAKAAAVIGFAGLMTAATIAEINYQTGVAHEATIETTETIGSEPTTQHAATAIAASPASVNKVSEAIEVSTDGELVSIEEPGIQEITANESEILPIESNPALAKGGLNDGIASSEPFEHEKALATATSTQEKTEERGPEQQVAEQPSNQKRDVEVVTPAEQHTAPEASTTAYFTHEARQMITPNGDPFNEHMTIEGYGVKDFFLQIATQSGQIVFESRDINVRWNGVDRFGNALPNGVYFYEIRAVGDDGLPYVDQNARGSVTIKR